MKLKKETYRQIIFLILIISGTILSYNTWFHEDKKDVINDDLSNNCKNNKEAERLLGFFIRNPNSEEGIDSLFNAIVYWDSNDKDSSVQQAIQKFNQLIKNDSLKNNFYRKLGKYYISAPKKLHQSSGVNNANNISVLLNLNKIK